MKRTLFSLALFAASSASSFAIGVGDTYAQVVAEKGEPGGKIEAAGSQILQYPDFTVKLRDGKVVSVEAVTRRAIAVAPSTMAAAAKPASAPPELLRRPTRAAWTTNFNTALEQAKGEGRNVFLFFTGSDWCGWCMRLQKEILTTPEFAQYAGEKLVLVELDFPNRKQIPAAVKAQNKKLAERFSIRGYPTVIVLNSEGRQIGQLGYQAGGPGPFVAALKKL